MDIWNMHVTITRRTLSSQNINQFAVFFCFHLIVVYMHISLVHDIRIYFIQIFSYSTSFVFECISKGLFCLLLYDKPQFLDLYIYRTYSSKSDINYEIRPMRRSDIQGLYELLAENKWNMEKSYLECVFNTDPTGLVVVVKDDGEIIGKVVYMYIFVVSTVQCS